MKSARFSEIVWALSLAACGGAASRAKPNSAENGRVVEPRIERVVISPDRVAVIAAGEPDPHGAVPNDLVLGRASANRRLFFHFPVTLPESGVLKSAAILLTRSTAVDMSGAIELHAMRVVDPWDAASVSWPLQPRIEDAREPHTTVAPAGAKIVRVDVAQIVRAWPAHDPSDQGVAVVADQSTANGASFAYISSLDRPPELEIVWAYPDALPKQDDSGKRAPKQKNEPEKKK